VKVMVAGIGNIFLGDDGFGVEVVRRLADEPMPDGVQVADYGTSGLHLAHDLLDGYDATILIDAAGMGSPPGTVYLVELDPSQRPSGERVPDAHGMQPEAVLDLVAMLGGDPGRVLLVGCEPATIDHHVGLSRAVEGAVEQALELVRTLVREQVTAKTNTQKTEA
jgi:hydrogenase maturation protease